MSRAKSQRKGIVTGMRESLQRERNREGKEGERGRDREREREREREIMSKKLVTV